MSGRRRFTLIFMLCALFLSASSVSYAFDYSKGNRQYYVLRVESDEVAYDVDGDEDDHQTDGGKYSSSHWDEPYPKHADSLNDLFALMISGDNVYFLGDVSFDVSSTIEISKDLNIYGSFPYTSGNNGKFEERNIKTHPTAFDAHNQRRVFHITGGAKVTLDSLKITGGGDYTDNGGVYVEGGCNIVVRSCDVVSNGIDNAADGGRGITIIASTALIENCLIADNVHKERCSGVYADSSDVVIRNCTFTGNVNHNDGGCGISLVNGTTASVSNCTITENEGRSGTGIYVNASRLNIQSCDISNNKNAATYGCGIALDEGSYAYIFNCTITSNDTYGFTSYGLDHYGDGGGIAVMGISSADIVSCDISRNTASYGGGVHVKTYNAGGRSAGDGVSSVTIKDCNISDNFCGYNHRGGGIDIDSAAAEITNCTISGNVVSGENWANTFGGGIHIYYPKDHVTITDCVITGNFANADGGGIYTTGASYTGDCSPVIKNCLISNNTATRQGGGIYVSGVYLAVDNCTIIGNKNPGYVVASGGTAGDEHGGGGGVYVGDAGLTMTNSTVTKNSTYYGAGGGGIYYIGTSWKENMFSNCTIVDNSARNGGIEIQRDGYIRASRIPFINSLIYNPTSPDRSFVNKDSERSMFFNCAIPESLALPSTSPSFDIVKIASWNPVSSTETINGITHTVYRIEDNPALKPIVGAGANRVVYSNSYYTPDVNYTSPSFDQIGTTRVNSPDIGAMEKAVTVPVLSADASIHVVVSNEIDPLTIADTEPNKALTWTVSGDVPSGVTASEDANGMTYTLSGAPTVWGDYSFSVTASNAKGSDDVKVSVIVYTAPVLSDEVEIKAVKGTAMSQTFPAVSGNHLAWTLSGDVPSGLSVTSDDNSFTVSGTPTTAGDYSFTLTASNMAGSDDIAVNVIVYEAPLLPDNIVTVEAVKDMSITETNVSASAGNHLAWSVRGNLPAGLTVYSGDNSVTATIMGTPTAAGDYDFSIIASNYAGSADIEVNAIVYEAPEISGSAVELQAVEGRAFSAREISVNAGNHLTWTKTGTFPDGMTFSGNDSSLSISGTPSAGSAGEYEAVFTASNLAGTASVTAKITVYEPPVLSGGLTIEAVKDTSITEQSITATSGNDITWSVSGTVPAGMSVHSADKVVTVMGTPTTAGDYTFTVKAANFVAEAEAAVNVSVYEAPQLSESSLTFDAVEGRRFTAGEIKVNAGNHLRWSSSGTLPGGMTVTSGDEWFGISGTMPEGSAGSYDCTFTAANIAGSATLRVSISVYSEPSMSDAEVTIEAMENTPINSRTITVTGNNLRLSSSGSLPSGMRLTSGDNSFGVSGTPAEGTRGVYTLNVTAENYAGSATAKITVNVITTKFVVESRDVSSSTTLEDFLAKLSPEQLSAIETLKLNEYFTDLSGLEKLTALRELNVSEAIALKEVNLNGNTSVKVLEVSGNESVNRLILSDSVVESVNAEGCSGLGSVEIAGNTSIRELNVSGTAIEVLNVEDCVNLEVLLCSSCRVSEFYLAGCSSLRTLDFAGNAIRKFNARGFPELESLECAVQTVEVDVLRKNFAFRDFMNAAKVSVVEGIQTLKSSGVDSPEDLNVKAITGYDASGNEISADYDGEAGVVKFSAIPHKITYSYMVLDGESMDVTISGDPEPDVKPVLEGNSFTIEATEGQEVVARTISALSGDNLVWTTSGTLPNGLTGSTESDGKGFSISGTPSAGTAGSYTYTVIATNSAGSDDAVVTVNVAPLDVVPVLEGASFTIEAREGQAVVARTISALSGDNLIWTSTGTLPDGLTGSAEADGKGFSISGTPSAGTAGSYTYTVIATNSAGSDDAVITVNVAPLDVRPVLEGSSFTIEATEGQAVVARTISVLSGDNLVWTSTGTLPNGLTGSAESDGKGFSISGTPSAGTAGSYTYTVTAANSAGSANAVITVNVSPADVAPVFSKRSYSIHAKEGEAISALTITATSGENLTWSATGTLPGGLTGSATSDGKGFTISGTLLTGTAGDYTYTVTARNSAGEISASVSITVSEVVNTQEKSSLSDVIDQMPEEKANEIKNLAVGDNVTDLSGLEKLTNLEALDLTEANSLTDVNLNGNTSVKDVDVSGNDSVKSLTLSESNVETVNAEGCDSLEEVNIAGNKAIKELNVSNTNVSSLNAEGCENLEVLECSSSKVSSLNLLGCLNLRTLNFSGNGIRSFNARGFNRLETLECSGQRVVVLVITRVFSIWDFLSAAQVSGVSASDADNNVKNVRGFDASGNEIASEFNAETGEVTFASAPSRITYDYDTGFDSDEPYMDVTITGSSSGETSGVGSSSGGCDAGVASFAVLAVFVGIAVSKKK